MARPSASRTIEQSGFLGDQYIAVEPTTNALPVFKHLETARAADPFNLQEAARKATGFIERLDTMAEKLDASLVDLRRNLLNEYTLTNLAATAANLRLASANAILAVSNINLFVASNAPAYAASGSNLMQFSQQLKELAASLSVMIETNSPGIHQSVQNVEGATASLKSMMEDAQAGKGLVGKLLVDEAMARDVGDISHNLSLTSSNLNRLGLWGILWARKPPQTNAPMTKTLTSPKDSVD
jgi:ABC-type transporter Mla subunit MlaD